MKKKLLAGLATGFFLFGLTSIASATPFNYSGPTADNVDNSYVTDITFNITDDSIITDLNVYVNVLGAYGTTGFPGNNNIWLTHNGVSVDLFSSTGIYAGAAGGVMDIYFDDEATSPTPTNPPFTGTVSPVENLSAFDGLSLNGAWTLSFQDPTIYPGEGDDLLAWSLYGDAAPVPEPATMLLFGTGLAGLAGKRIRRKKK